MLYTENPITDYHNILEYIDELSVILGVQGVQIDTHALLNVCIGMREKFPHIDGEDKASVFKKMGNFLAHFLCHRPVKTDFPLHLIDGKAYDSNAFIAFEIAIFCIENSSIHHANGEVKKLEKPIFLSGHSYADIICALSDDKKIAPDSHYHIYSVFLEQLAYKTNPKCQYEFKEEFPEKESIYNGSNWWDM